MSATRRIELPSDMLDELDKYAQLLGLGYATTAEAVKDAIRRRTDELRTARINRQHITKANAPKEAEA
jgi:metal-responsive CopG/Arc/MetJ family transcriptional regulator